MATTYSDFSEYSIYDWLNGIVGLSVPDEVIYRIMMERGMQPDSYYSTSSEQSRDLMKADLYMYLYSHPTKAAVVKDGDSTWSHSEGGQEISDTMRKDCLKMAKALYKKWGEENAAAEAASKSTIRINSRGFRLWRGH